MTAPHEPQDEFTALMSRFLDGVATEEERRQLEDLLDHSRDARTAYLDLIDVESRLLFLHVPAQALADDSLPLPPVDLSAALELVVGFDELTDQAPSRGARTRRWLRTTFHQSTALSLLISGLFLTTLLLSFALWNSPIWQPPPLAEPAEFVARLTRTLDAQWSIASNIGTDRITDLHAGHPLELHSGLAEIVFDSGAAVLLEGPVTLVPRGKNRLELRQGKLAARVPPRAIGFTVDTAAATLIDLGTEFGVEAGDERANLSVFDGAVEVQRNDRAAGRLRIAAGESVTIDRQLGTVTRRAAVDRAFVRTMPRQTSHNHIYFQDFEDDRPGNRLPLGDFGWSGVSSTGIRLTAVAGERATVTNDDDMAGQRRTWFGAGLDGAQWWWTNQVDFNTQDYHRDLRLTFLHRETHAGDGMGYRIGLQVNGVWHLQEDIWHGKELLSKATLDIPKLKFMAWPEAPKNDAVGFSLPTLQNSHALPTGRVTGLGFLLVKTSSAQTFRLDAIMLSATPKSSEASATSPEGELLVP